MPPIFDIWKVRTTDLRREIDLTKAAICSDFGRIAPRALHASMGFALDNRVPRTLTLPQANKLIRRLNRLSLTQQFLGLTTLILIVGVDADRKLTHFKRMC